MAFSPERPRVPEKGDDEDSRKKRLLEKVQSPSVKEFVKTRTDIAYEQIIPELIKEKENDWHDYVVKNFAVLTEGIDSNGRKEIIRKMVEKHVSRFWFSEEHLHNLTDLSLNDRKEIMYEMFCKGRYHTISHAVNFFSKLTVDFDSNDCESMAITFFEKLIEKGKESHGVTIARSFSKKLTFKGIDSDSRKRIVLTLIKRSNSSVPTGNFILEQFLKFTDGIDHNGRKEIMLKLIKTLGYYCFTTVKNPGAKEFIYSLNPKDRKDTMYKIFSAEKNDDPKVVMRDFSLLADGINPSDREDMVLKLMRLVKGSGNYVHVSGGYFANYLPDLTKGISSRGRKNIVLTFMGKGVRAFDVFGIMEYFSTIVAGIDSSDRKPIIVSVIRMIEYEKGGIVFGYFVKNFPALVAGVDSDDYKDIILGLAGKMAFKEVLTYHPFATIFANIKEKDHEEVALGLIRGREGTYVEKHFSLFTGITEKNHEDFLLNVIALGETGHRFVIDHIHLFTGVRFISDEDQRNLAFKIIALGRAGCRFFVDNLSWLAPSSLDHNDAVLEITKIEEGKVVADYLGDFVNLDDHTAFHLLEMENRVINESVVRNITSFNSEYHNNIALKLIEEGEGWLLIKYKSEFNNLDHGALVQQLIEHNQKWVVVWYADRLGVTTSFSDEDYRESFIRVKGGEVDEEEEDNELYGSGKLYDDPINSQFEQAAETFGWKNMFRYKDREGVSFHDVAHALDEIVQLHAISELSPQEFFNNILSQVQRDTSRYGKVYNNEYDDEDEGDGYDDDEDEGEQTGGETSYHYFNSIAQTMSSDIEGTLAQLRKHTNIEQLQELLHVIQGPKDVFASWNNLKRYQDLSSLLEKMDVLDKLEEIKESNPDLYTYVDTLAFHKDSKINMQKVILFLQNPKAFLSMDDSHTEDEVQDRKKPSNYTNIPYLDLSAEELRDALVDGTIDKIAVFPPMEVRYTVAPPGPPTRDALNSALGKREVKERDGVPGRKGIPGKAKSPRILFTKVASLLKPLKQQGFKGGVPAYIEGKEIPETIEKQTEELVYNKEFGMEQLDTTTYIAKITEKKDPIGAITGNDITNCMPFGSGKNTVYTFNPNTAQVVIRIVRQDGTERTIAQSVLTKDMDVKRSVPSIIDQLEEEAHLEKVLPEEILTATEVFISCDDIELAPAYQTKKHKPIVKALYWDVFNCYFEGEDTNNPEESVAGTLNTEKVLIGRENSKVRDFPREPNTYIPQSPVGYSDKEGEEVYVLNLKEKETSGITLTREITEPKARQLEQKNKKTKGINPLTYEDSIKVGYLESKAYDDAPNLIESLSAMQNTLTAKDINNAIKDRPNLSFSYTDEDNHMRGYILAYEGVLNNTGTAYDNKPCIHIADLATDKQSKQAGRTLIKTFINHYQEHYINTKTLLPIYAEIPDTTSLKLTVRQLDTISKRLNISFELVTLPTYKQGDNTLHPVVIVPKE